MSCPLYLSVAGGLDGFVHLALGVAPGFAFAFVVILLAPAEPELYLAPPVLIEIDGKGDERQTLLGLDSTIELADLLFVHQKSAHSERVYIVTVTLLIRRYVHSGHHELTFVGDFGITLFDTDAALTDRLDLGTCEDYTGLIPFFDEIVVECFLVICDYFFALFSQLN